MRLTAAAVRRAATRPASARRSATRPTVLICGGRRCGAGVLHRALAAHPEVAARTLDCADYLYRPHAPARIAAALPEAKVLVVVRDPVTRAWSQHAQEVAAGHEWERDFTAALELEAPRLDGEVERLVTNEYYDSFAHRHHAYRANGEYVVYLDALATYVDRDRILVVDAGRLRIDPQPVYDRVLEFLGLPNVGYPRFARRLARYRGAAMDPAVRRELTDHYEKYDARLVPWLGHQPSWRVEPPERASRAETTERALRAERQEGT